MEAFFRSARQPSRPSEWTLEEAARFAALKEGYLLQFLSTHKKAFATARRLGLPLLPAVAVTHACKEIHYNVMKFITKQGVTFGGYAPARDRPPDRSHSFPGTPRDPPS